MDFRLHRYYEDITIGFQPWSPKNKNEWGNERRVVWVRLTARLTHEENATRALGDFSIGSTFFPHCIALHTLALIFCSLFIISYAACSTTNLELYRRGCLFLVARLGINVLALGKKATNGKSIMMEAAVVMIGLAYLVQLTEFWVLPQLTKVVRHLRTPGSCNS